MREPPEESEATVSKGKEELRLSRGAHVGAGGEFPDRDTWRLRWFRGRVESLKTHPLSAELDSEGAKLDSRTWPPALRDSTYLYENRSGDVGRGRIGVGRLGEKVATVNGLRKDGVGR